MRAPREIEKMLIQKIHALPPEKVAEVEDFVDFLFNRLENSHLTRMASKLAENCFTQVWDNQEDAEYDRL